MALDKLTKVQSVGISSFIQVVGVVTATGGFVGDLTGNVTGNITGTTSNASGATGDFSIADKIVHTGDTNTALRFPAADTITAETAGSERLRITSGGDVGIGDNSPNSNYGTNLSVHSTATDGARLKLSDGTTGKGNADGLDIISTGSIAYFINRENADMAFYTNNTERLRITSAGIVRIPDNGKLTCGAGNDLEIYHNGSNSYIDDAGTGVLYIRSNQTEMQKYTGETVAQFLADGAVNLYHDNALKLETVSNGTKTTGRVYLNGTNGGLDYNNIAHTLEYLVNGSTHSELNTGAYVPATSGSKNLGANAKRWNTLYLSNGIDFSANSNASGMTSEVLDDYEEGAFDPRLRFGTSTEIGTFNTQSKAEYVKIGKIVHVSGWARYDSVNTSNSGILHMDLPFTVDEYGMPHNYVYPGSVVLTHTDLQQKGIHIWCGNAGSARTRFGFYNSTSGSTDYIENGDLGGWNGNTRNLHFNFSYQTND